MPARSNSKGRRLVVELPAGRVTEPLREDVAGQLDHAVTWVEVGE